MPVLWVAAKALASRLLFRVPKVGSGSAGDHQQETQCEARNDDSQFVIVNTVRYRRACSTLAWCIDLLELAYGGRLDEANWTAVCHRAWIEHIKDQRRRG